MFSSQYALNCTKQVTTSENQPVLGPITPLYENLQFIKILDSTLTYMETKTYLKKKW